jgi:hypothetical protein
MAGLPKEALALPDGYMLHRQPEREGCLGCHEENRWVTDSASHSLFLRDAKPVPHSIYFLDELVLKA